MTAGGYMYAQATVGPYNTTTYTTCRTWALAVHKARCEAFLKATAREETGAWTRVQTSLYNEFSDTAGSFNIYVQDIHPVSIDTGSNWPSFVSFFKKGTSEYCIITSRGFNFYSSYKTVNASNIQKGLYIDIRNARSYDGSSVYTGYNLMHAFALNGFSGYDVAENTICSGRNTTKIVPCYTCTTCQPSSSVGVTSASTDSLVSVTSGASFSHAAYEFTFGYAVKGTQIECFLKRSDRNRFMWSIIGEIIGVTSSETEDNYKTGSFFDKYSSAYECDSEPSLSYNATSKSVMCITCMKTDGYVYNENSSNLDVVKPSGQCMTVGRVTTTTAENIGWSACPVCFYASSISSSISQFTGLDGDGNGMKGFIDSDLLRLVSATQTQIPGATYGDGNFVAMYTNTSQANGYILGWDPSNPSIV